MRSRPLTALDNAIDEAWWLDAMGGAHRVPRCPGCDKPSSAVLDGAPACVACTRWALRCFAQVLAVVAFAGQWCPDCRERRHRGAFEAFRCEEGPIEREIRLMEAATLRAIFGGI